MINYPYVLSQSVTILCLPIYFIVILFKLLFTDDITNKMLQIPKWKFIIMGILDGLSLLILFTSGNYLQGILQGLLVQSEFFLFFLICNYDYLMSYTFSYFLILFSLRTIDNDFFTYVSSF
jgi:hypothetical protein